MSDLYVNRTIRGENWVGVWMKPMPVTHQFSEVGKSLVAQNIDVHYVTVPGSYPGAVDQRVILVHEASQAAALAYLRQTNEAS